MILMQSMSFHYINRNLYYLLNLPITSTLDFPILIVQSATRALRKLPNQIVASRYIGSLATPLLNITADLDYSWIQRFICHLFSECILHCCLHPLVVSSGANSNTTLSLGFPRHSNRWRLASRLLELNTKRTLERDCSQCYWADLKTMLWYPGASSSVTGCRNTLAYLTKTSFRDKWKTFSVFTEKIILYLALPMRPWREETTKTVQLWTAH